MGIINRDHGVEELALFFGLDAPHVIGLFDAHIVGKAFCHKALDEISAHRLVSDCGIRGEEGAGVLGNDTQ